MPQSSPSLSAARRALVTIAITAVALSPALIVTEASADPGRSDGGASTTPRSDFSADVRSINHGLGIVTLVGTGPAGGSVGITGDGVETRWTAAGRDGIWTTTVRVRSGERVLRVTSQVSGQAIDVPVDVLLLQPPGMTATVDGPARTISFEGTGHAEAHFVIKDDGETVGETDADADGAWSFTLRDLDFGDHHVEAWQYFDGTHNGGVDEVYTVSGAAVVSTATASRETERIALTGRAPVGTTLRFADDDGPVLDAHGRPVTAATGADTSWSVELPIAEAARFTTVTVTTFDGATELGTTEARVTVPLALTGTVDVLADGSVRLAGTGEIGGVVSLEAEDGTPLESPDGYPVATSIGRGWELTVPRALFPDDVVVARQRVDGVAQGALRLVLPKLPVHPSPRPEPGQGPGHGTDSGPGVSTGTHPTAQHPAAGPITVASARQLAYTGADTGAPVGVAGVLLASGLGGLVVARRMHRRGAHRQ